MSTFGNRTVLLRKSLGLTQKEFALAGNFSQSNLSLMENDGVIPNLQFVIAIATAFPSVRLDWWVMARGSMFIPKTEAIEDDVFAEIANPSLRNFLKDLKKSVDSVKEANKKSMINLKGR